MDNPQKNNEHARQREIGGGSTPAGDRGTPAVEPAMGDSGGENVYIPEQKDNIGNSGRDKNNLLDILYGVLFEPARTFAGFTFNPPIGIIVVIFVALNLAEALTGIFTTPVYLDQINFGVLAPGAADAARAMVSFAAVAGFIFSVVKWFFMAGLLHLLAELYGGTGTARSVWAVYGAAGLPAVFMIPLQIAAGLFHTGGWFDSVTSLLVLGLYVWGVVLLVIGVREVHHISTGRAVLVVLSPLLALVLALVVAVIFIGTVASAILAPFINLHFFNDLTF